MQELILLKYGELILKGLNRPTFEQILINNVKQSIKDLGNFNIKKRQATIYVEPLDANIDIENTIERLKKVFGIAIINRVVKTEKDIQKIEETAVKYSKAALKRYKTFKVETKRSDKQFPLKSPEISKQVGAVILKDNPNLKVNVHKPEITINIEVREEYAYISTQKIQGAGGLPVASNGKATLLLSGGIDSPVAGWMMAKRGVEIDAIYYHSPPYTGERAKEKVIELARILTNYCRKISLHIIPFTEIQLQIYDKCPDDQLTLIMRRIMMMIAEKVAVKNQSKAIITGESLGQVASQTIEALAVTNAAINMPIFQPLIGLDKNEIVEIARKINTFETSILPYEDCCTIFVPKRPQIKPKLDKLIKSEEAIDIDKLIKEAIEQMETIQI